MAYIIIVNPAILAVAGIPKDAQVTATILAAVIGCLIMAFWAKRPFAIAPYMSENAFVAFVVVKGMGYSWQIALGAVFWAGLAFLLLTLFKVRSWLAESIPLSLKASFAVGIGLFLTFIGLNEIGLVVLGVPGAPVRLGNHRPAHRAAGVGRFSADGGAAGPPGERGASVRHRRHHAGLGAAGDHAAAGRIRQPAAVAVTDPVSSWISPAPCSRASFRWCW